MNKAILNIGIDLGTTFCECQVFSDITNKPELLYLHSSKTGMYPSVVYYDESTSAFIVGDEIKDNKDKYINAFKFMKVKMPLGDNYFEEKNNMKINPISFQSHILTYIYRGLENSYGSFEIQNLVITVPAYFKDNERRLTIEAARLAGFNPTNELRLINEPTAAALSFGEKLSDTNMIVTYDLGGGTFDVTLLNYEMVDETRFYQAIRTNGKEIGGKNFDDVISLLLLKNFLSTKEGKIYNGDEEFKKQFIDSSSRLAETIKINLSIVDKAVGVDIIKVGTKKFAIDYDIDRTEFISLIKPFVDETLEMTKKVIEDYHIDKIILVGGSTKIPYIQKRIELMFEGIEIISDSPDLIVSEGAAIQAGIMAKKSNSFLNEILSTNLGISMMGNLVTYLLYEGTPIPYVVDHRFYTVTTNSDACCFLVQGNDVFMESTNNQILGELKLKNLKSHMVNTPIDVRININNSGIIDVFATEAIEKGKTYYQQFKLGSYQNVRKEEHNKLKKTAHQLFKTYTHVELIDFLKENRQKLKKQLQHDELTSWVLQEIKKALNEIWSESELKVLALRTMLLLKRKIN